MSEKAITPRERARVETTEQIKQIALDHLAVDGPDLSLRAVARDMGMVSSAVYRYFASRDDLLTALILDGYISMADTVERAEAVIPRRDIAGRFLAHGRSTRAWALEHPHEYALLYGSPVPGYEAPEETIGQAQRPIMVMMRVLADGVERGVIEVPKDRLPRAVRADIEQILRVPGFDGVAPTVLGRAMTVWAMLYGTISFELFGRYTNAVIDLDAYFEHQLRVMARHVGVR